MCWALITTNDNPVAHITKSRILCLVHENEIKKGLNEG